jgi:hypothetical protein
MANSLLLAAFSTLLFAFVPQNMPEPRAAISVPPDRANASYAIYSKLLPFGETVGDNWPHKLWLVAETTTPLGRADGACKGWLNANRTVTFPPDRRQDFHEIIADFDLHCQDRLLLKHDGWNLPVPVVILNKSEQDEYGRTWGGRRKGEPGAAEIARKYEGASGIYSFSQVFFNLNHTVALVESSNYCGGMCGDGQWQAFALQAGEWKRMPWPSAYVIV